MAQWNKCPGCNTTCNSNAAFCPVCGTPWTITCPECGESWRFWKNYKFCPACGTPVEQSGKVKQTGTASGDDAASRL